MTLPVPGKDNAAALIDLLNGLVDAEVWNPETQEWSGSGSLGLWLYGDGSDGPIKFTASPRTITDGSFVGGSAIFESATADFTHNDVGLVLSDAGSEAVLGLNGYGARIIAVTDSTHAVMSCPVSLVGPTTGDTVVIGDENFAAGMYSSVTIPTGATVRPLCSAAGIGVPQPDQGWMCSGEFYIDGTIDLSAAGLSSLLPPETGPGVSAGSVGTLGGNGGAGSTVTAGDTPGGVSYCSAVTDQYRQPLYLLTNAVALGISGLGQGACGGGDGINNGGVGGAPGLVWAIASRSVVHGPNASYLLTGGDGQDGAGGNAGGGGGGGDGWWITLSDSLTGAPALVGGGGEPGVGKGTGSDGTRGQPGFGTHYTPSGVTTQTP